MDADAFKAARRKLGQTEVQFAQSFGVSRRTVQNWSAKGPPAYVGELLQLALVSKIPPPDKANPETIDQAALLEDAAAKLRPVFDEFLRTANSVGWSTTTVIATLQRWMDDR